jgi:hypothetical protein
MNFDVPHDGIGYDSKACRDGRKECPSSPRTRSKLLSQSNLMAKMMGS